MSKSPYDNESELTARLHDPATRRRAFEDVITRYGEQLYWQIRRMVHSHEDADDILQNTFLKAWTSLEQFRGDAKLTTWLHKIAINESLTHLDQLKRRAATSLDKDDEANFVTRLIEADTHIDGDELALKLRKAVATLPQKQQLVFNMRYYDEMPYEQISNILGTSVGALKASYHLAQKKIQQYFADD
ncbi:MAG: RNA polymerase sigma factor [Muribaculaceae bacterium]|nr:RNA polymerase sigma factor [Muribaculaceae bacterium]